ncbi:MAG: methylmalonyl-CoA mutase [Neobacillus sp.]|jgi:methylmalonyl-CoA mutase|nr:methylmalonyl-CoA mutase [Neobacillus sp.]
MSFENLKNQTFPSITKQDWKLKAEESMKGKSVDLLQTTTYEDIKLKALYTRLDEQKISDYPGGSDFRRGIYPLGYQTNNWKIAQRLTAKTLTELKGKIQAAIKNGQTAIAFDVSNELFNGTEKLSGILGELIETFPFAINTKERQPELLTELTEMAMEKGNGNRITGYVANDPISIFAEEGRMSNEALTKWSEDIKLANSNLPILRTVLVNTTVYHQGGANAVQELGIAAATGVYYIQRLFEAGMKLDDVLSKMIFQFSIGSNFFMELAKLRAARILWNKITGVYGAEPKSRGMHITAETSTYTKTVYDPHVNILRAGNEAFAAVLGGVQYLHVAPFDDVTGSTPLSERIARNTQNILMEEAYLQKVADPAGGSWYVESLTAELAEKAWAYFQQLEANGGILEVLQSNKLQNDINAISEKRKQDTFTRKQSVIGTNIYANLEEQVQLSKDNRLATNSNYDSSQINFEAIKQTRGAEPFESLREISLKIENKSGSKPQISMLCLGELRQYKPRLDFVKGFLAVGGIKAFESSSITSYEAAKQFVQNHKTNYLCLCGSNEQYEQIGHEMVSTLKKEFPDLVIYMAGLQEKEDQIQWLSEGIRQFVHVKSNCYETLSIILKEMEVFAGEASKA